MIGYIYKIINKVNGKKYIGQTIDITHRLYCHFSELEKGTHHSVKLQREYNKYGREAFDVEVKTYEILDQKELCQKEILAIKEDNSFYNGYNMTMGGEGNNTRIDFETAVLINQVLLKYEGIKKRLAKYFHCDFDCIQRIALNPENYTSYLYDEAELEKLLEQLNIDDGHLRGKYKLHTVPKLNEQDVYEIYSIKKFGEGGYSGVLGQFFGVHKDSIQKVGTETYKYYVKNFLALPEKCQKKIYLNTMEKYNLKHAKLSQKRHNVKQPLSQEQVNYILDHFSEHSTVIARHLGVSVDRVRNVKYRKSYVDLIKIYEKQHADIILPWINPGKNMEG